MEFIFKKLLGIIGAEKLFLMAWNSLVPVLIAQAKKSDTEWDDKAIMFMNDLVLLYTGKKKPSDIPDVVKPVELAAIEAKYSVVS